ncbi:DUF6303 family protein [Streptomyces cinereoruber]|uniref:DUF6303 family protein n=1 Tax=Streptomyces cinereoruber TaxID=67260 RepID=UPI003640B455
MPRAVVSWADPETGEGGWKLHLVTDEWEASPAVASWPEAVGPPSLLDRYDALAALGYTVVEGGPEAWQWRERMQEGGHSCLYAYTSVRPLVLADMTE